MTDSNLCAHGYDRRVTYCVMCDGVPGLSFTVHNDPKGSESPADCEGHLFYNDDAEDSCRFCGRPRAAHPADDGPGLRKLRAEVREWLCDKCNTVYPGPPQPGFSCVICPKCGGYTSPRLAVENRRLGKEIERLRAEVTHLESVSTRFRFQLQEEYGKVSDLKGKVEDLEKKVAELERSQCDNSPDAVGKRMRRMGLELVPGKGGFPAYVALVPDGTQRNLDCFVEVKETGRETDARMRKGLRLFRALTRSMKQHNQILSGKRKPSRVTRVKNTRRRKP
jgi:hypothetical protein